MNNIQIYQMDSIEHPLKQSAPFHLKGYDSQVVQIGNVIDGYVALVPCSTEEQIKNKDHLIQCWNDRISDFPLEGDVVGYTICDAKGEVDVNICIPDGPGVDCVIHFPARSVSLDAQQLAELGHLLIALSAIQEKLVNVEGINDMLTEYGFTFVPKVEPSFWLCH